MKRIVVAAPFVLLLASCDGGFKYDGSVSSSSGAALKDCSTALNHEGQVWEQPSSFTPPNFSGQYIVATFKGVYVLVISCAGHKPRQVVVNYGSEVTPTKDLHLGNIVLEPLR